MDGMELILRNLMEIITQVMGPATALILALGVVYAIVLGAKYSTAKGEELDKVKALIKDAIIGIFLLFILYASMFPFILKVMLPWVKANANSMAITAF